MMKPSLPSLRETASLARSYILPPVNGHKPRAGGYTIIEAMFFLVISAALFASVVGVYASQNRRTQFYQSVQNFDQKIRDILNDVETGYYPSSDNITCSQSGGGLQIGAGTVEQGTNQDCVFAGKVLQLQPPSSGDYTIFTLAGLREATSIDDAAARAAVDLGEIGTLSAGLLVTNVITPSGSHSGLAILSSFGDDVSQGDSGRGNRTTLGVVDDPVAGDGSVALDSSSVARASDRGILICLQEPGNGRMATILVGGNAEAGTIVTVDGECTF